MQRARAQYVGQATVTVRPNKWTKIILKISKILIVSEMD